jgi:crossover junction endodeoxyribonuclease RuvC
MRKVQPATWKDWYSLTGKKKAASLHTARTLFPALTDRLKLQKHHNRAESLLIAHYGRRVEA